MRKKFLSLLLALTMVLSLTVVPARATGSSTTVPQATQGYDIKFNKSTIDVHNGASSGSAETTIATLSASESLTGATYAWHSEDDNKATVTVDTADDAKATVTAKAAGTVKIWCTVTLSGSGGDGGSNETRNAVATITVTDVQGDFETALKSAKVTFKGRAYQISEESGSLKATVKYFGSLSSPLTAETTPTQNDLGITGTTATVESYSNTTLTVKNGNLTKNITLKADLVNAGNLTESVNKSTAVQGETVTITPQYTAAAGGPVKYQYTMVNNTSTFKSDKVSGSTYSWEISKTAALGEWTITCDAYEGDTKVATVSTAKVTVKENTYYAAPTNGNSTSISTLVTGNTTTIYNPAIKDNRDSSFTGTPTAVKWELGDTASAKYISISNDSSKCTVTALDRSGEAKLVATATYNGLPYKLTYTIKVKALDTELGEIENGGSEYYSASNIKSIVANVIDDVYTSFSTSDVASITLNTGSNYLTLKNGSSTINTNGSVMDGFDLYAKAGYIGEASFQLKVNDKYIVTLYLDVTSDGTVKETVTGTTASSSVSFDVDDVTGGDYLYIYGTGSKTSFSPSSLSSTSTGYDGYWDKSTKSGWALFDDDDTVTIPASKFSSGKVTLYVVSLDSKGVASAGTIEVSQKDYSIKYNVVAGESVSFEQDDFEDFLEEYAEDNGGYNSRKDELVFDYAVLTSSIPSSKNEGTLYYGSTEITSSNKSKTEMEDMDKASFDAAAKAKDTVTMTFRVYGDLYKNGSSKKTEVKYDVNVVISVVKEDIVYTVGVNSSVKFDDDDFQDYLNDYSSSYRKSTLSYVTFEVGRNSAISAYFSGTGALYRYYSAYGTSSAVSESDEFYYEPKSSSKNYDLADVTYVTTRFAKAGDTVYIPFTAYGTKSEKVTGTVAIKIKQTMNFTDVHTYDYFYDSVQWAVNNNVTAGTSATTFSPSQSCTRAQIVTFLWRAAGSPEPRSTSNPFTDVSATRDADYYKAILWAVENKITTGTSATTFSPSGTCTRAQIVTFLYRYKGSPSVSGSLSFTDVSKTTHSAYYNAILWAVRNSVTTGNGNNTFAPSATCNRGEAVTFLYRALA